MKAFTLIETLLSVTLLALVLILVLNLFPSSMATVRASEQRYRAGALASSVLEQQATRPFSDLTVGLSQDLTPQTLDDQVEYKIHLDVAKAATEDPSYLRAIRVTVSWSFRGQDRQIIRELWVHHLPSKLQRPANKRRVLCQRRRSTSNLR